MHNKIDIYSYALNFNMLCIEFGKFGPKMSNVTPMQINL